MRSRVSRFRTWAVAIWRGFPGGVLTAQFYNLYTLRGRTQYIHGGETVYNGNWPSHIAVCIFAFGAWSHIITARAL